MRGMDALFTHGALLKSKRVKQPIRESLSKRGKIDSTAQIAEPSGQSVPRTVAALSVLKTVLNCLPCTATYTFLEKQ